MTMTIIRDNILFKFVFAPIFILFLLGGISHASIDNLFLEDMTLSWSNSGWMQVQRVSDQSTECEGNINMCTVSSPGTFNIINHTTQQRVDNYQILETTVQIPPTRSVTRISNTCQRPQGRLVSEFPCAVRCPEGTTVTGITACQAKWIGPGWTNLNETASFFSDEITATCLSPFLRQDLDRTHILSVEIGASCM